MKNLLLLTLNTFSATGGIERVCQIAGKALHQLSQQENQGFALYSMYDAPGVCKEQYIPKNNFKGFNGNRVQFVWQAIKKGRQVEVVVLSHINLLSIGYLIKKISPQTKISLLAHRIEVWSPLSTIKRKMLSSIDLILAVSQFTKQKLVNVLGFPVDKIQVINNCIDPFLSKLDTTVKQQALKSKYGFNSNDFILFTLSRLKFSEQYKGYDKVIAAITALRMTIPFVKYLIVGKYDQEEKARIDAQLQANNLTDAVVFAGFIDEEDMAAHFNLADVYIMPSTGEGFGIVFIEALYYGKPVIAGNKDGSVDALDNGRFGILVNPDDQREIIDAVVKIKNNKEAFVPNQEQVIEKFGFASYKNAWQNVLYRNRINVKAKENNVVTVQ